MNWGVISTQSILVVAIVDGNFDGDRCIDKSNDGGGNSNEVCISLVCSASEPFPCQ